MGQHLESAAQAGMRWLRVKMHHEPGIKFPKSLPLVLHTPLAPLLLSSAQAPQSFFHAKKEEPGGKHTGVKACPGKPRFLVVLTTIRPSLTEAGLIS